MDRSDIERLTSLEEKIKGQGKALELQAREYERRLETLNHAYRQAQDDRSKYVSIERFTGFIEKMEIWQHHVDKELARSAGKNSATLQVITLLIAVAAVVVAFVV
jgi:hypothetical protein